MNHFVCLFLIHSCVGFNWSPITELEIGSKTVQCATEPYLNILVNNIDDQYKYIQSYWTNDIINDLQKYSIKHWFQTLYGRRDKRLHSVEFDPNKCTWTHSKFPNKFADRKTTANMKRICEICKRVKHFPQYLINNTTSKYYSEKQKTITFIIHIGDAVFYPLPQFPIFSSSNNKQMNEYIFLLPSRTYYFNPDLEFITRMTDFRTNLSMSWHDKIPKAMFVGYGNSPYPQECEYSCRGQLIFVSSMYPDLFYAKFAKNWKYKGSYRVNVRINDTEQMKYKFIIICDGYSIADRFPRQLLYNSVIFKQNSSRMMAFWYPSLIPFVHYIPFNDVYQLKKYMQEYHVNGTINNLNDNDLAQIAENGMNYIYTQWTRNRMDCYIVNSLNLYTSYFQKTYIQNKSATKVKIETFLQNSRFTDKQINDNDMIKRFICGQIKGDCKQPAKQLSWVVIDENGRYCNDSTVKSTIAKNNDAKSFQSTTNDGTKLFQSTKKYDKVFLITDVILVENNESRIVIQSISNFIGVGNYNMNFDLIGLGILGVMIVICIFTTLIKNIKNRNKFTQFVLEMNEEDEESDDKDNTADTNDDKTIS